MCAAAGVVWHGWGSVAKQEERDWVGRMSYQVPGWGVMWTLSTWVPQKPMACFLEVVTSPFWLLQGGKDAEV